MVEILDLESRGVVLCSENKVLISCEATVQLLSTFVFHYMQKAAFLMTWLIYVLHGSFMYYLGSCSKKRYLTTQSYGWSFEIWTKK